MQLIGFSDGCLSSDVSILRHVLGVKLIDISSLFIIIISIWISRKERSEKEF